MKAQTKGFVIGVIVGAFGYHMFYGMNAGKK